MVLLMLQKFFFKIGHTYSLHKQDFLGHKAAKYLQLYQKQTNGDRKSSNMEPEKLVLGKETR